MRKKVISVTESYRRYLYMRNFDIQAFLMQRSIFLSSRLAKPAGSSSRVNNNVANLAYRFCGVPPEEDLPVFNQNIGNCRFLWNIMTSEAKAHNKLKTPAGYKQDFEWLSLSDSLVLCNVQKNFERTLKGFFNGDNGFPNFKKKRYAKRSFTTNNSNKKSPNLRLEGNKLYLPKTPEPVELIMHREIIPGGILKSCTVTQEPNGKWYFSLIFEYPLEEEVFTDNLEDFFSTGDISKLKHIGLDMSLPKLYIDSNGNIASYTYSDILVEFEKFYRKTEKQLAREQRKLSRMKMDSANYIKQKLKIAKLHAKIKHQRNDFLHQLSIRLARTYDVVSIEDLNLQAMKKSLNFGKSVSDNGWGNFTNMLEHKCRKNGALLIRVGRFYPSSKTCSCCGYIHKELTLEDRTYECPNCGAYIDRDINAAINIDREGLRILTGRDAGDSLSDYGMTVPSQSVKPVTQKRISSLAS